MKKEKANNWAYKNRTEPKQTLSSLNKYETHPRVTLPFTSLNLKKRNYEEAFLYTYQR